MPETEDGYPGEGEEYEEEYHYQDWGVDRVDLDFQSGEHSFQPRLLSLKKWLQNLSSKLFSDPC